jgi:purine nucleosidase
VTSATTKLWGYRPDLGDRSDSTMSKVAAQELVIDTDPGTDDAHALVMAASHPGARIHAICTVHGNVPLRTTTRNALAIAELAGIDAPIHPGADQPLTGSRFTAADVHGADGLGGRAQEPERLVADSEHAAQALVRLAREHPHQLTYVTLGPLTNLALALALDPELPSLVRRLVIMGGATRATGNVSAVAEFNVRADPEAAAIVLARWLEPEVVTWETTLDHAIPSERFDELIAGPSDRAAFIRDIYAAPRAFVAEAYGATDVFVPDQLAMAVALEPHIVEEREHAVVDVELGGQYARGQTIVVPPWLTDRDPHVHVVKRVERSRLEALVRSASGMSPEPT